jgi:hypothetical protein
MHDTGFPLLPLTILELPKWYKENAGQETAERFVDAVEEAINFVQAQPLTCRVYYEVKTHPRLQHYEFRKWSGKGFPHSLFSGSLRAKKFSLKRSMHSICIR